MKEIRYSAQVLKIWSNVIKCYSPVDMFQNWLWMLHNQKGMKMRQQRAAHDLLVSSLCSMAVAAAEPGRPRTQNSERSSCRQLVDLRCQILPFAKDLQFVPDIERFFVRSDVPLLRIRLNPKQADSDLGEHWSTCQVPGVCVRSSCQSLHPKIGRNSTATWPSGYSFLIISTSLLEVFFIMMQFSFGSSFSSDFVKTKFSLSRRLRLRRHGAARGARRALGTHLSELAKTAAGLQMSIWWDIFVIRKFDLRCLWFFWWRFDDVWCFWRSHQVRLGCGLALDHGFLCASEIFAGRPGKAVAQQNHKTFSLRQNGLDMT